MENKATILLNIVEPLVLLVVSFFAHKKVKNLRQEVDALKRDADNFGELLGTERAKARLNQKENKK